MAELKTKRQNSGVTEFLTNIPDEAVRKDCQTLADMMSRLTDDPGDMWGTSVVGFGQRRLTYATGRELDWFAMGFSPRKGKLTLYLGLNALAPMDDLLAKLGPHSLGKGCLYIRRLSDVDMDMLTEILQRAKRGES